jgi:hypothetical protein
VFVRDVSGKKQRERNRNHYTGTHDVTLRS